MLGRVLLHAAAVGAAVGLASLLFVYSLEVTEHFVLERLAGYVPLRAAGEGEALAPAGTAFRPWLLLVLPAIGALLGGAGLHARARDARRRPDAIIDAFHNQGGVVRRRVPIVKTLASISTLGIGGSGGREGPTMQIGGALGSIVGRYLRVTERERRILLVAGIAAGMSAVFRTPLGAALLAVEVLYRDDFESDALVPSVLASVVSYSVFISFFGESTLFAHAAKYPFVPAHLPLYALMALVVSARGGHRSSGRSARCAATAERLQVPAWAKPALGGLLLGAARDAASSTSSAARMGEGQGLGILGGGYGAAQVAITGAAWLPERLARRGAPRSRSASSRSWPRRSPSAPAAAPATSARRS